MIKSFLLAAAFTVSMIATSQAHCGKCDHKDDKKDDKKKEGEKSELVIKVQP